MYLKRRPLIGDVIAHSALPGIVVAYWVTESKNLSVLLLGALVSGLLGMAFHTIFRKALKIYEDSAMSLILSVMFGIGITLSRHVQNVVPNSSKAGLDNYIYGKAAGILMQDVWLILGVSLLCLVVILPILRAAKLMIFDSAFAGSLGWNVAWFDYLLLALLSIVVVIGLPMVGIVMVAAIVLIPPAAARFWTDKFKLVLLGSGIIGMVSCALGSYVSAIYEKTPTGPSIIIVAGSIFLLSSMFAPKRGVISLTLKHGKKRIAYTSLLLLSWLEKEEITKVELLRKISACSTNPVYNLLSVRYLTWKGYAKRDGSGRYILTDYGSATFKKNINILGGIK